MGPVRIVPVAVALVLVTTALAGGASPAGRQVPHVNGQVATHTVPGGSTTVTSGALSDDVRSADVFIETDNSGRFQEDFKFITYALMAAKTKKKRLVACAVMAANHQDSVRDQLLDSTIPMDQVEVIAGSRAAAYALMCMRMSQLMAQLEAEAGLPPARTSARAPQCSVLPVQVKVRTERTAGGGYRLVPRSGISNGRKALPVRTTCKATGTRLTMRVTPKRKGPLSKAVGPHVIVGVANPPSGTGTADLTVGFKGR